MRKLDVAMCQMFSAIIVFAIALALVAPFSTGTTIPSPHVCDKAAPAKGSIPDPQWAFSYSSWTEPYATDASRYLYQFVNLTDHNVPVRWLDANIVRMRTAPNERVQSESVDAVPPGLRSSAIAVGLEGAAERRYLLKTCFSNAAAKQRLQAFSRYGSSLRFKGTVVSARSDTVVMLDIEFKASIDKTFARFNAKYEMINNASRDVLVGWVVPGFQRPPIVAPANVPTEWGQLSYQKVRPASAPVT